VLAGFAGDAGSAVFKSVSPPIRPRNTVASAPVWGYSKGMTQDINVGTKVRIAERLTCVLRRQVAFSPRLAAQLEGFLSGELTVDRVFPSRGRVNASFDMGGFRMQRAFSVKDLEIIA
jgi:hypothetical protein